MNNILSTKEIIKRATLGNGDPWDSQGTEKMQFLFLLLLALTF